MRAQEIELIKQILILNAMKLNRKYDTESSRLISAQESIVDHAFEILQCEPSGTVSSEFLNDSTVLSFIQLKYDKTLKLWHFIHTNELDAVEQKIKDLVSAYRRKVKFGIGIPPKELYSSTLMRCIYLSGHTELINIFIRHLPIPGTHVFKGHEIPSVVAENEEKIEQSIKRTLDASPARSVDDITGKIINMQRTIRAKLRHQEEINRIASRSNWQRQVKETSAEKLIQDANKPYRPRCENKDLARRIMSLSEQVRLFSTVKHWTSGDHIESIFNDALYGRRQLLESYLSFRPATLHFCDIADGDGNVICLGPAAIDPRAMQVNTIEIMFDLDTVSSKNPTAFYKQHDFGFGLNKKRSVSFKEGGGTKSLFFSHTSSVRCQKPGFSYLSVYDGPWGDIKGVFALPNYSLISYNVQNIHQILTLNFFKFLDSSDNDNLESPRHELYADLEKLTDEELLKFLTDIGRQLTDTSEFNFYGAHQIDFSTVIALTTYPNGYTINLQDLIDSLEHNEPGMLHTAKTNIPGAFASYRFLDYLLSKTTSVVGRYELQQLRSNCSTPTWIQPVPKPEPMVSESVSMNRC